MLPRLSLLLLCAILASCAVRPAHNTAPMAAASPPKRGAGPMTWEPILRCSRQASEEVFQACVAQLREGDLIGYQLAPAVRWRQILTGNIRRLTYELMEYGHIAMVVHPPEKPGEIRLFTSLFFVGPTMRHTPENLRQFDWTLFRAEGLEKLDRQRLHEFIALSQKKAHDWNGYDFSGAIGWNNLALYPSTAPEIGEEYTCPNVLIAALHYAGAHFAITDARYPMDIITPYQLFSSRGYLVTHAER